MKIAIIGTGAMGCLYGAFLIHAGCEVFLIGRTPEHVALLNQEGITIFEGEKVVLRVPARATLDPAAIGAVDTVLVLVKSFATSAVAPILAPLLTENTLIITLQNGVGNWEILAQHWGTERVAAGMSTFGAAVIAPGKVRLNGRGQTVIGEAEGRITPRLEALAKVLERAGLNPHLTTNIKAAIWDKLLVNVGINALTAILEITNGNIAANPYLSQLAARAVKEAETVARACGIPISPDAVTRTLNVARQTATNLSSMLQDIRAGRETEIDFINGAICQLGRKAGIPTPVNEVLSMLVKAKTTLTR